MTRSAYETCDATSWLVDGLCCFRCALEIRRDSSIVLAHRCLCVRGHRGRHDKRYKGALVSALDIITTTAPIELEPLPAIYCAS